MRGGGRFVCGKGRQATKVTVEKAQISGTAAQFFVYTPEELWYTVKKRSAGASMKMWH